MHRTLTIGLITLMLAGTPAAAYGWVLPPAHLSEPHMVPLSFRHASWMAANVVGDRGAVMALTGVWRTRPLRDVDSEVIDCWPRVRGTVWRCAYRLRFTNRHGRVVFRERGMVRVTHRGWVIRPRAQA